MIDMCVCENCNNCFSERRLWCSVVCEEKCDFGLQVAVLLTCAVLPDECCFFLLRCTQRPMGRPRGKPSRFTFSSGTQLDRRGGLLLVALGPHPLYSFLLTHFSPYRVHVHGVLHRGGRCWLKSEGTCIEANIKILLKTIFFLQKESFGVIKSLKWHLFHTGHCLWLCVCGCVGVMCLLNLKLASICWIRMQRPDDSLQDESV